MTDPTLTLKKGLQRVQAQTDPVMKYAIQLKERDASLTDEEAYRTAEEILSREATPRVRTEDDDEELKAWKAVVYATVSKVFGANDPALRNEFAKEFESQIKDVTAPQGGTENLTNVRSPGLGPAKTVAEPNKAGYGRQGSTIDDPSGGWYDSTGKFHSSANSRQPATTTFGGVTKPTEMGVEYSPREPSGPRRTQAYSQGSEGQYGPVGQAGRPSSIDTYQPTKPGDVRPSYRGVGPRTSIPDQSRPEGGVSKAFGSATDRREAEQLMGKAFLQALDQADLEKHSMEFDVRRTGMGTVKEATPDVEGIPIIRKEFDRLAKSGPESTDTSGDEHQFDYDHFRKAYELDKQASGMRRLAADQELAGNLEASKDLLRKARTLQNERDQVRKQVHQPSLKYTLRTALSKSAK